MNTIDLTKPRTSEESEELQSIWGARNCRSAAAKRLAALCDCMKGMAASAGIDLKGDASRRDQLTLMIAEAVRDIAAAEEKLNRARSRLQDLVRSRSKQPDEQQPCGTPRAS